MKKIPTVFKIYFLMLIVLVLAIIANAYQDNLKHMQQIKRDIEDAQEEAQQAKEDAEDARQEMQDALDEEEFRRLLNN